MIFSLILCIFILGLYCVMPLPLQLVLFVANGFVPDPIPFIDELIMIIAMFKNVKLVFLIIAKIIEGIIRLLIPVIKIILILLTPFILYGIYVGVRNYIAL